MNYIVNEKKLFDIILKYLLINFTPDNNWGNSFYRTNRQEINRNGMILFFIDGERVFALIQEFDEGEIKYSLMVSLYMYQNMTDLFKDKWIQIFKDWFELNSGLKINKIKIQ